MIICNTILFAIHFILGFGGGRGPGPRGRVTRDRDLIGTTIKITKGPYKGNIGVVKDATQATARIELHTCCQTISVDRKHIADAGTFYTCFLSYFTKVL